MRLLLLGLSPFLLFVFLVAMAPVHPVEIKSDAYPDHLDGPLTGGFGEQTCHSCHFDNKINDERGSLYLKGVKESYRPGKKYNLTVRLEDERLENGGFQLTARFEDGSQAGRLQWDSERLSLTPDASNSVQYLQHAEGGTSPTGDDYIEWSFVWKAPESEPEPVIFNLASNAGNNDNSAFGDWIYVKQVTIQPAK